MAAHGGSLPERPQFFKIIFPEPSFKLEIPKNFHANLPSELPKTATLLCPHAEFWFVEICQDDKDVIFQKGWPEFTKAHDLCTGYLLLFQYNGDMNFEVKVFNTSCCLKDYSLKHCTRKDSSCVEIEVPSCDLTLSDASKGETHHLLNRPTCKRPAYIEIGESSESEDQTIHEEYHEIPVNSFSEEKKLSDSDDNEREVSENNLIRDIQMEVQSKVIKTNHETNFKQFEKILTSAMVSCDKINIPRAFCMNNDLVANSTIFLKRKILGKIVPKEWRVEFFFGPRENRIRKGWRIFSKENNLKNGDKCTFLLVSTKTFVVEIPDSFKSVGCERKYVNGKVQGMFNEENRSSPQQHNVHREKTLDSIYKGPSYIEIENFLESDDGVISRVSDEMPGNCFSKRRKFSNSNIKVEEQEQEQLDAQGKKSSKIDPDPTCFDQFEKVLTYAMVKSSQIYLPMAFCLKNGLVTSRTICLRMKLEEGNVVPCGWPVQLNFHPSQCRLLKGWRRFSKENSLKAGDRCLFQLVSEDSFLVQKMPPESLSTKRERKLSYKRASSPAIASKPSMKKQVTLKRKDPGYYLQCERIVKGYNLKDFMSLCKTFCMDNGMDEKQTIILKSSSDEKSWPVRFEQRRSEGRLCAGWIDFARENGLREGDQCTFQLTAENTLHVNIVRKCQKEVLSQQDWRSGIQNSESEISLMVRQYHLNCYYMNIPMSFCLKNNLTSQRQISLESPNGKVWHVNFLLNGSKEGRFNRAGWRLFAFENGLQVGDKCLFKLVGPDTMHVQVAKA